MSKGMLVALGALVLALVAGLVLVTSGDDGPKRATSPKPADGPARPSLPVLPRRASVHADGPDAAAGTAPALSPDEVDPAARPSLPALAPASLATVRGSVFARTRRCFGPLGEGPGGNARGSIAVRARAVAADGQVRLVDLTYTPQGIVDRAAIDCVRKGLDAFEMKIPGQPDGEQPFVSSIQVP